MSRGNLKPGWTRVAFGDVAVSVNDRIDNPLDAGVECYVGLEHLDSDSLAIRRWAPPTAVTGTKLLFRRGDIIFGRRRVYQRKLAVADFDGICSAHALVLRAKSKVVLPEFLPFFMQSDSFMKRAEAISVGSLSPTINWRTLASEEFALPPLDEQHRMANLLKCVQAASRALQDAHAALATLRKSTLMHTFGQLLADPAVRRVPVGQVGEVLLGRQRAPQHEDGPSMRPYLRAANVFDRVHQHRRCQEHELLPHRVPAVQPARWRHPLERRAESRTCGGEAPSSGERCRTRAFRTRSFVFVQECRSWVRTPIGIFSTACTLVRSRLSPSKRRPSRIWERKTWPRC